MSTKYYDGNYVHFLLLLNNFKNGKISHSSIACSVSNSDSCLVSGTSNNTLVSSGSGTEFGLLVVSFNSFWN